MVIVDLNEKSSHDSDLLSAYIASIFLLLFGAYMVIVNSRMARLRSTCLQVCLASRRMSNYNTWAKSNYKQIVCAVGTVLSRSL